MPTSTASRFIRNLIGRSKGLSNFATDEKLIGELTDALKGGRLNEFTRSSGKFGELLKNEPAMQRALQNANGKIDDLTDAINKGDNARVGRILGGNTQPGDIAVTRTRYAGAVDDLRAKGFGDAPPPPRPRPDLDTPPANHRTTISEPGGGTTTAGGGRFDVDFNNVSRNTPTPTPIPANAAARTADAATDTATVARMDKLEQRELLSNARSLITEGRTNGLGSGGNWLAAQAHLSRRAIFKTQSKIDDLKKPLEEAKGLRKQADEIASTDPKRAADLRKQADVQEAKFNTPKTQDKLQKLEKVLGSETQNLQRTVGRLEELSGRGKTSWFAMREDFKAAWSDPSASLYRRTLGPLTNQTGRFFGGFLGYNQFDTFGTNTRRFFRNAAIATGAGYVLDQTFLDGAGARTMGRLFHLLSPAAKEAVKHLAASTVAGAWELKGKMTKGFAETIASAMSEDGVDPESEQYKEKVNFIMALTGDLGSATDIAGGVRIEPADIVKAADRWMKGEDLEDIKKDFEENVLARESQTRSLRGETQRLATATRERAAPVTENLADAFDTARENARGFSAFTIAMNQIGSQLSDMFNMLAMTILMPLMQKLATTMEGAMGRFAGIRQGAQDGHVASLRGDDSAQSRYIDERNDPTLRSDLSPAMA